MEQLAKRKELIITNGNYLQLSNRQLSDKANYKQLSQDPTLQHNRMFNQKQKVQKQKITSLKITDGLKVSN